MNADILLYIALLCYSINAFYDIKYKAIYPKYVYWSLTLSVIWLIANLEFLNALLVILISLLVLYVVDWMDKKKYAPLFAIGDYYLMAQIVPLLFAFNWIVLALLLFLCYALSTIIAKNLKTRIPLAPFFALFTLLCLFFL